MNYWLLFTGTAGVISGLVNFYIFYRNHTPKKYIRLFNGLIISYLGIMYCIDATGYTFGNAKFSDFLAPVMFILFLIPAFEAMTDYSFEYFKRNVLEIEIK